MKARPALARECSPWQALLGERVRDDIHRPRVGRSPRASTPAPWRTFVHQLCHARIRCLRGDQPGDSGGFVSPCHKNALVRVCACVCLFVFPCMHDSSPRFRHVRTYVHYWGYFGASPHSLGLCERCAQLKSEHADARPSVHTYVRTCAKCGRPHVYVRACARKYVRRTNVVTCALSYSRTYVRK